MDYKATREVSYASSAQTWAGRAVIRSIENLTGRVGLIRRAQGYEVEVAQGHDFWTVMADRYGLDVQIDGDLAHIPETGPVIVVANHPFGILDGLMMGKILSARRSEFRILAHEIFRRAPELDPIILPVSFQDTRAAQKTNLHTRATAISHLRDGGAVGIFPGGTVSTSKTLFSTPMDPGWRTFTAKMVAKSGATVVPVYFDGANSRLFQIASHLHPTLRLSLLIREFARRVDHPVRITIGSPVDPEQVKILSQSPKAMMDFLRKATYELGPQHIRPDERGFEFEEKHKT